LGHTSTRQDQLSVAGSVASPGCVALILKGSTSCELPKSAREQFHRSS
jgi:hypothetical protein